MSTKMYKGILKSRTDADSTFSKKSMLQYICFTFNLNNLLKYTLFVVFSTSLFISSAMSKI